MRLTETSPTRPQQLHREPDALPRRPPHLGPALPRVRRRARRPVVDWPRAVCAGVYVVGAAGADSVSLVFFVPFPSLPLCVVLPEVSGQPFRDGCFGYMPADIRDTRGSALGSLSDFILKIAAAYTALGFALEW